MSTMTVASFAQNGRGFTQIARNLVLDGKWLATPFCTPIFGWHLDSILMDLNISFLLGNTTFLLSLSMKYNVRVFQPLILPIVKTRGFCFC